MLIKAISDTHNSHDLFDSKDLECDILIHCGDACVKGNYTEAKNFLQWFVKQPAKYKIVVWGNHDKKAKTNQELIDLAKEYGIIALHEKTVEINGIKIHGNNTVFMDLLRGSKFSNHSTESRKEAWSTIPEGIDILVTHCPPYRILDANVSGVPIGCPALADKIEEVKPKMHLFGHCHENAGEYGELFNPTNYFNCASMDRSYKFTGRITEIEIK